MTFAFGDFELDESLYQLRRRGEVVRLASMYSTQPAGA